MLAFALVSLFSAPRPGLIPFAGGPGRARITESPWSGAASAVPRASSVLKRDGAATYTVTGNARQGLPTAPRPDGSGARSSIRSRG